MPQPRIYSSIEEFRQAARGSEQPAADSQVRASFDTEVKVSDAERTITFTISTASVDRMGDTLAVDGWQLANFRKNPVVLWAHDSSMLPVAKANKLWIEAAKLKSDTQFTPVGMARFNDTVFDMYKGGFLSATSVGFLPLKYAFTDDPQRRFGIDFLEQELLEFSCVPVPANAEALIEGKSAGIDIVPLLDWAEQQLRKSGDSARIIKLADSVLGSSGSDMVALAWAERIAAQGNKVLISRAEHEKAQRLAKQNRLRDIRLRDLEVIKARTI